MNWREHEDKIVHLDITTYVGTSLGATHTYGELVGTFKDRRSKVQVERPMTQVEATRRNKLDRREGRTRFIHKAGEITSRLKDEEDVVNTAIGMWREHFPWAWILLIQKQYSGSPGKIIDSPDGQRALEVNLRWADWMEYSWNQPDEDEERDLFWAGEWTQALAEWLEELPEYACEPDAIPEEQGDIASIIAERREEEQRQQEIAEGIKARRELERAQRRQEAQDWHLNHPYQELALTIVGRSMWDEKQGKGLMTLWMCCADAYDENDERLGSIKAGIGGSWWIFHREYAPHGIKFAVRDIWDAFVKAAEAGQIKNCRSVKETVPSAM